MKTLGYVALVWATLAILAWAWKTRYTTNTAGGRFYRTDHWTGQTLVVEKDGSTHPLRVRASSPKGKSLVP